MILSQICNIYDGTHQTPKYVDKGVPFYSVEHVSKDDFSNTKFITEEVFTKECQRVSIEQGDILMTRIGSVGVPKFIDWNVRASFYVSLALLKPKAEGINMGWLSYYIQSPDIQRDIWRLTIHVAFPKKINLGDIGKIRIKLPPKAEQESNYALLKSVDRKINLLTKKKEALETYKKGLMQKIFMQELRFKRDDGTDYPEWKKVVYSEFLKERDDKHPQSDEFPLCSFVAHKGVVPKGDRYNREFLVNDKKGKKYKRTKKGDFIYSSNNLETGSIGLNEYGNGCISPVYSVFSIDNGCDINFIAHYLVTKANLHKMIRFRQGVMYGQWRIHETDFLKIKVAIPSNEEQKHIGEVIKSMNSGLEELERLISATSKLKKGLLQQMFV